MGLQIVGSGCVPCVCSQVYIYTSTSSDRNNRCCCCSAYRGSIIFPPLVIPFSSFVLSRFRFLIRCPNAFLFLSCVPFPALPLSSCLSCSHSFPPLPCPRPVHFVSFLLSLCPDSFIVLPPFPLPVHYSFLVICSFPPVVTPFLLFFLPSLHPDHRQFSCNARLLSATKSSGRSNGREAGR